MQCRINHFKNIKKHWKYFAIGLYVLCSLFCFSLVRAEEEGKPRRFNDVIEDLLNEFAFDLKSAQQIGMANLSIRRIALNESIPRAYESYIESLIVDRIHKFSNIKVIQCTKCRVKRTVVENNRLVVTVPINNPTELDAIAKQLGVETWMDAGVIYQESSIMLSVSLFDSKTKELLWTKVYNSESLERKASGALKDGKDSKDGLLPGEKPKDPSHFAGEITVGYVLVPNVKVSTSMLGFNFRAAEKFNYDQSEVGAILGVYLDPALFIKNYDGVEGNPEATGEVTAGTTVESIKPFKYGLGLFADYHHHFITIPENTELARFGISAGIGLIAAQGYLSFSGRGGVHMKLGRHFILECAGLYSLPTTIQIKDKFKFTTKGGIGANISFGFLF